MNNNQKKKRLRIAKCKDFPHLAGSAGSLVETGGSELRGSNGLKMLPVFKQLESLWPQRDEKSRGWKVRETDVIICAAVSHRNNAKPVMKNERVK